MGWVNPIGRYLVISRTLSLAGLFFLLSSISFVAAQQITDSKFPLFENPEAAQHHCPFDSIVWLDTKTDTYSVSGPPADTPKGSGAYMCQRDADQMDYKLMQKSQ